MVNPISTQAVPYVAHGAQADTQQQVQAVEAAVQVTTSEKSETFSQQSDSQPQPWPQRKQLGPLIEPPKSSLDSALEQLNDNLEAWATGMRFDIDPDTQKLVVSLVDNESGDVIRSVPSEAVLRISKMIAQFQGNGINTKA